MSLCAGVVLRGSVVAMACAALAIGHTQVGAAIRVLVVVGAGGVGIAAGQNK